MAVLPKKKEIHEYQNKDILFMSIDVNRYQSYQEFMKPFRVTFLHPIFNSQGLKTSQNTFIPDNFNKTPFTPFFKFEGAITSVYALLYFHDRPTQLLFIHS